MDFDERGYICPYNDWCRCKIADCDFCGWNPVVSERRMEEYCRNHGIMKSKPTQRPIDAVDLVIKIEKRVAPMLETECSQRRIYSEVMKCISTATTLGMVEVVPCEECMHLKACSIYDIGNFGKTDFCPYGERGEKNGTE